MARPLADAIDTFLDATVAPGFSRVGYAVRRRTRLWEDLSHHDLTGRTALVTGATSGIGRATALALHTMGARVLAVGRDERRLGELAGRGLVTYRADLADLAAVRSLAAWALADPVVAEAGLHVLVHNAGALLADYTPTPQGLETTYAVHVVAPTLLTTLLLPALHAASAGGTRARVVTVSSGGMYAEPLDVDRLVMGPEAYDGVTAYARAKRAQVALTEQWARRHGESVTFHAMHPGWADTPGVEASLPRFHRLTGPFLRTPEQGADTVVWLAAAEEPLRSNGGFWCDRRRRTTSRMPGRGHDEATSGALWESVAAIVSP